MPERSEKQETFSSSSKGSPMFYITLLHQHSPLWNEIVKNYNEQLEFGINHQKIKIKKKSTYLYRIVLMFILDVHQTPLISSRGPPTLAIKITNGNKVQNAQCVIGSPSSPPLWGGDSAPHFRPCIIQNWSVRLDIFVLSVSRRSRVRKILSDEWAAFLLLFTAMFHRTGSTRRASSSISSRAVSLNVLSLSPL